MHHREGGEHRRLLVRALVLEQRAAQYVVGDVAVAKRRAASARADHLAAVADGEDRFVSQFDGQRNRAREQIAIAGSHRERVRQGRANTQRPHDAVIEAGADLDLVRTGLALDLCALGLDVVDVLEAVDRLAVGKQWP